jgi:hypothetical protein
MNRWLKILAIIVVIAVAGTYGMYAMLYKGNYNVGVSVKLSVSSERAISLSDFTYSSSPTDALQFWEQMKGSGDSATTGYIIYWDFDNAWSVHVTRCTVLPGESIVLTHTFSNVEAGASTLTITVRDAFNTYLHERTFDVVVG